MICEFIATACIGLVFSAAILLMGMVFTRNAFTVISFVAITVLVSCIAAFKVVDILFGGK